MKMRNTLVASIWPGEARRRWNRRGTPAAVVEKIVDSGEMTSRGRNPLVLEREDDAAELALGFDSSMAARNDGRARRQRRLGVRAGERKKLRGGEWLPLGERGEGGEPYPRSRVAGLDRDERVEESDRAPLLGRYSVRLKMTGTFPTKPPVTFQFITNKPLASFYFLFSKNQIAYRELFGPLKKF
jgi:hypothetical protein